MWPPSIAVIRRASSARLASIPRTNAGSARPNGSTTRSSPPSLPASAKPASRRSRTRRTPSHLLRAPSVGRAASGRAGHGQEQEQLRLRGGAGARGRGRQRFAGFLGAPGADFRCRTNGSQARARGAPQGRRCPQRGDRCGCGIDRQSERAVVSGRGSSGTASRTRHCRPSPGICQWLAPPGRGAAEASAPKSNADNPPESAPESGAERPGT